MNVSDYINLYPSYVHTMDRFIAISSVVLAQVEDLSNVVDQFLSAFSVENAVGDQLDAIGESFGLERGTEWSDETYRLYMKIKLALWSWNGINETVNDILGIAIPGATQEDNCDLTVTGSSPVTLPDSGSELFPVPPGVQFIDE